ncbi:MAG: hypothetical protein ACE5IY_16430 [bacterium]
MAPLKKREKVLVTVTGAVLVLFLANQFDFTGKQEAVAPGATKATPPGKVSPELRAESAPEGGERRPAQKRAGAKWGAWGRDPFAQAHRLGRAALTPPGTNTSTLELRGIIWNGNDASALIGDRILRKGERMGALTVLDILPDRVVCKRGSEVITLTLQKREE